MSNKLSLQCNEFKFYHHTSHDDNFYVIECKKIPQDSNLNDHYDYDDRGFFYEHLNNENYYVMYKLISHTSVLNLLNGIEIDVSILKRESLNLNQRLQLEQELKKIVLPSHFVKFYVPEKEARTDYSGSMNSFHDHNTQATLVINNPTYFDNGLHQQNGVDVNNIQQQLDNNIPQHINDHHHPQQQAPQHAPERISLFQENNMMETNYNGDYNYVNQDAIGGYTHQQQVDSHYTLLPNDDYAPANGGYTQRHTNLLHENNGSIDASQNCDFLVPPNNNIVQTSHPQHPQHLQQVDQNNINISQEMRSTYSHENNELPRDGVGNCIYSPQQQYNNFPHHQFLNELI